MSGSANIPPPLVPAAAPPGDDIDIHEVERERASSSNGDAPAASRFRSRAAARQLSAGYFTRGSHQDGVLRVQGTPNEITRWEALGREDWDYGNSTVTISTHSRQVLQWSNRDGNLKVRQPAGGR